MPKIRIETERVREVARRLMAQGDRIEEMGQELRSAVGSLDTRSWDGVSRARAEGLLGRVGGESARVAGGLGTLGRLLMRVADRFEEEDQTAARNLVGMPWVDWEAGAAGSMAGEPPEPGFRWVRGVEDAEYGRVEGRPFIQGRGDATDIEPEDVDQGRVGDCYLLASLAAISLHNPEAIRDMIRDNGDGTYTVTLYDRPGLFSSEFRPVEVVVEPDFPLEDGDPVFARAGDAIDGEQELWPMLVEKAYAQHHGGYGRISGGWGDVAMEELTGVDSTRYSPDSMSFEDLIGHYEEGHAITASSLHEWEIRVGDEQILDIPDASDVNPLFHDDRFPGNSLSTDHEYYVTGVDSQAQTVSIRNPWGWEYSELTLSFEEFQEAFRRVSVNPINS